MKIHDITTDDMKNGDGLRVVLWVSGCEHHCPGCQNPITWDPEDGEEFTTSSLEEIVKELKKDYISGITFSGGDPLHPYNRSTIALIAKYFKSKFPEKDIWCYTGYLYEKVKDLLAMNYIDVLVDGPYIEDLRDLTLHWRGSSNQRVIDVKRTLESGNIVLWDDK